MLHFGKPPRFSEQVKIIQVLNKQIFWNSFRNEEFQKIISIQFKNVELRLILMQRN